MELFHAAIQVYVINFRYVYMCWYIKQDDPFYTNINTYLSPHHGPPGSYHSASVTITNCCTFTANYMYLHQVSMLNDNNFLKNCRHNSIKLGIRDVDSSLI